ncbi:phage tail protein [Massilia sp. S19_KUP03_FR1]|uniref:phage tail protein n=1 Tax=Massilia sp. S19_KUP03_FR1 TaxID=3025503 RepID=UPI002FCD88EF
MCALAVRATPRRVARPKSDPRYLAVTDQVKAGATRLKQHAPPAKKAREASHSAKAPANERVAAAKAKAVDEVKAAPTPRPQPQSFKAQLRAEIDKAMPKTLGDTEKFMDGGVASTMKRALGGGVDQQTHDASGPLETATKKAPDSGAVPAQPSTTLPAEPTPLAPPVAGASAMPAPASAADVTLDQSKKDTAQALDDEKIKPDTLQKANDPRFSAVAGAQAQVAAQADKGPPGFRANEAALLAGARAKAGSSSKQGTLLLAGTRGAGNAKVMTRQQQQAAREEAERKKVAADIEAIYSDTRAKVEGNLGKLDAEVSALFDPGIAAALAAMKTWVDDKLFNYKLERYLSIPLVGLARWVADQVLGLPPEVNAFYVQGRLVFQAAMDRLIDRVADLVETRLAQAKADIAGGQKRISAYVAQLPAGLKAAGEAAESAVADRFAELAASIDEKKDALASALASQYKDAFDKADESLKQMQDENKSLLQQFAEKLGEIVKAMMAFKAQLLGLIKKGQETIQLILDDPIGFLGNLLAAVKGGFNAFVGNIWTHLQAGFIKWLFASLASAGIALPADLTLPSILKLVLGVLGITYEKMRAKAVKLIGERAVGVIEKVAEYVKALIEGGVAKLWELVKEDLANLKDMVIGAIQDWLIETVIKQAVAKVVSMFNPAGAIVQAVIAIYNVVMFVIEKAQQIMTLVEAVVNSVHAIATGAIGGAISWIEKALASAIPVVIGFLARLIGLGGISDKIKKFIEKVQARVDKAIDKAIAKVVAMVKKLFGKLKAGAEKLVEWWKKKLPFKGGGESHTLQFDGSEDSARLAVHSGTPQKPGRFVQRFVSMKGTAANITRVRELEAEISAIQKALFDNKKDKQRVADLSKELNPKLDQMTAILTSLLVTGAEVGSKDNPVLIDYPKRKASSYVTLYIGPPVPDGVTIQQTVLAALAAKKHEVAKEELTAKLGKEVVGDWNGEVKVYPPTSRKTLDGEKVGLSSQFASLATGVLLTYDGKESTGGGGLINKKFARYGFSPTGDKLDGDHVLERQLGGPDRLDNLWPLASGENRSSGAKVKSLKVKIGEEEKKVHQVREEAKKPIYLLVRSTRG